MTKLPYLASPGNISKALEAIKRAPTPPRVSQDFVKTKLGIPGSSGDQMTSFLKRIGFASSDGAPTELYKRFRTNAGGLAIAEGIRSAYSELYDHNEYMHECSEQDLRDLIIQVTGLGVDARPISLIYSTLNGLIDAADFTSQDFEIEETQIDMEANKSPPVEVGLPSQPPQTQQAAGLGLNIGYTINLNLPETTNIEVFNAIFKSLKEHLLRSDDV